MKSLVWGVGLALFSATGSPCRPGYPNAVTAGMKPIPGGSFRMGRAPVVEPVHRVTLSPFHMDSTEVTQREYQALMHANPSHFTGDPDRPVETVSWFDAILFCNARSKARGLDTVYAYSSLHRDKGGGCDSLSRLSIHYDRKGFRLPTEAEYEYAERAGSTSRYYWGDSIDGAYCWYFANSDHKTHPVARKRPNAFGLYDMSGNIWEWCNDWFSAYAAIPRIDPQTNPVGPPTGAYRVLRGGSWYIYYLLTLESAYRFHLFPAPNVKPPLHYYGFRCVLPARWVTYSALMTRSLKI